MKAGKCAAVLLLAAALLCFVAANRSFEYDEAYSVFVTSGTPRPNWPNGVFRVSDVRSFFRAHAGPAVIASALRRTDVHPPLYFWLLSAWRVLFGDGLLTLRLLSVFCALTALLLVGRIAVLADLPASRAMLLTLGSYGFAYTGAIARGFALAQALGLAGTLLTILATRRTSAFAAAAAGVLFGAAMLTNYLAAFVGIAALGWLLIVEWRRPRLWLAGGMGFAAALPPALWFFLAQRDSRPGQFPPFHLASALARLAQYGTADLLGGLPLYASGALRVMVTLALAGLMTALIAAVAVRWGRIAAPPQRWLLLSAALAPPAGLLGLGMAFDTTPIELRYLCFSVPFAALLFAGGLDRWRAGRALEIALAGVQTLSLAGLALHPATMQPFRRVATNVAVAAGAQGVILAPRGNDGVGAVAPLVAELPDQALVRVVARGCAESVLHDMPEGSRVVVARLGVDAESRLTLAELDRALPRRNADRSPEIRVGPPQARYRMCRPEHDQASSGPRRGPAMRP